MAKITYIEPSGAERIVDVKIGMSLMEGAVNNSVEGIEADCGGVCACSTCHVYIQKGYDSLPEPSENEEDMLDQAWGLKSNSRLSCQAIIGDEDVVVEIPIYSVNLAKEAPH